jgi:hypothetical protein
MQTSDSGHGDIDREKLKARLRKTLQHPLMPWNPALLAATGTLSEPDRKAYVENMVRTSVQALILKRNLNLSDYSALIEELTQESVEKMQGDGAGASGPAGRLGRNRETASGDVGVGAAVNVMRAIHSRFKKQGKLSDVQKIRSVEQQRAFLMDQFTSACVVSLTRLTGISRNRAVRLTKKALPIGLKELFPDIFNSSTSFVVDKDILVSPEQRRLFGVDEDTLKDPAHIERMAVFVCRALSNITRSETFIAVFSEFEEAKTEFEQLEVKARMKELIVPFLSRTHGISEAVSVLVSERAIDLFCEKLEKKKKRSLRKQEQKGKKKKGRKKRRR